MLAVEMWTTDKPFDIEVSVEIPFLCVDVREITDVLVNEIISMETLFTGT